MRRVSNLILIMVFSFSFQAKGDDPASGFNKRDNYLNKTTLGDPVQAAKFTDPEVDVSHLSSLSDSSLVDRGSKELRKNPMGKTLQNAEEQKIDAIERYKINPENPWLKNSLLIEENPMAKTGGKGLSATEKVSSVEVKKSCTEGVDFNVDVGLELVLECEEEEADGEVGFKSIEIPWSSELEQNLFVKGSNTFFGQDPALRDRLKQEISSRINNSNITIPVQQVWRIAGGIFYSLNDQGQQGSIQGWWHPKEPWRGVVKFYYNAQGEKTSKFIEKNEYWQVVTEGMEQLAETNECYETARVCLKSGVKTFFDKYQVSRPCWYEKISYRCTSEPKDGCAHLIKQDCKLKDSVCEHQVGSICLRWKREFVCGGIKKELFYSLADSPIYCLGGDCHTPVLEENRDFSNVAYLAALNEASKDCVKESNGLCKDPITVFAGQVDGCEKTILGAIDCCSSMKGWGKNAHLCKCSGAEKGLALKRDKGLCHEVGMYCSKKDPVLGQCLMKKRNFCCFSSKLARIFHEQGRKQLGIDWGSPRSPNCRPFTLDELKSLDFSKFDMEELFDALLSKGKSNANKSFPILKPGEIPPIQKEHMATSTAEKREIRRRKEEEEARRLELERLAKLEEERLVQLERERIEKLKQERRVKVAKKEGLQKQIDLKQQEHTKIKEQYERALSEYYLWSTTAYVKYGSDSRLYDLHTSCQWSGLGIDGLRIKLQKIESEIKELQKQQREIGV